MIYNLRQKFIKISMISFLAVFVILFASIFTVTTLQTNASLDRLADVIADNGGRFPKYNKPADAFDKPVKTHGFDRETPFTTRFFTVGFDENGSFLSIDIQSVASVSEKEAVLLAEKALQNSRSRGWIEEFRYKRYDNDGGKTVLFINGTAAKQSNNQFMLSTFFVFAVSNIIILMLVIVLSKKAVKPMAESYEKQKQFITDANHELKTPLTLIQTNLDILKAQIGQNEWLSDIQTETESMTELVNRLVMLAGMDEEGTMLEKQLFSLSEAVTETAFAFSKHIESKGIIFSTDIAEHIDYHGNEAYIRQLLSILLDNAVKYCDAGGTIAVSVSGKKHPVIAVSNSCEAIDSMELDKLFDRFYRADKARTFGSGFGIGLSVAKSIVEKHGGEIKAINSGNGRICFRIIL